MDNTSNGDNSIISKDIDQKNDLNENISYGNSNNAVASSLRSFAEGYNTVASGIASHAEGVDTIATGDFSHAEGKGTDTNLKTGAHIMGIYGDATGEYSWHLANGVSPTERGLAARIGRNGIGSTDYCWIAGNSGYSEMFETVDGNSIEPGYFVTLRGRKIKIASTKDRYILGVTTSAPGFLGNGGDLRWKDKYVMDEWGRIKSQEVVVPAIKDDKGNIIVPEHKERRPLINPNWKSEQAYVQRLRRPEWVTVILLGQVLVRDNGMCKPNGYCIVNDQGIAISAQRGYRVLERTGTNQILILLRSASFSMKPGQER